MRKFYTSIILIIFLFTNSCDSVRSALGGSKQNSSDEFLVKKKKFKNYTNDNKSKKKL